MQKQGDVDTVHSASSCSRRAIGGPDPRPLLSGHGWAQAHTQVGRSEAERPAGRAVWQGCRAVIGANVMVRYAGALLASALQRAAARAMRISAP